MFLEHVQKQKITSRSFKVIWWDAYSDFCMSLDDQLQRRQNYNTNKFNLHSGILIHNTVHKNYVVKFSFMYHFTWIPQHETTIYHTFPQAL